MNNIWPYQTFEAQTLFWENLNYVMAENGVPNVNFKGFMTDNAQVSWNAVRKIYRDGEPRLPIVDHEHTCLFYWSVSLDKVTDKYINPSLQFQHKQTCKDYKDTKTMDEGWDLILCASFMVVVV